MNDDALDGLVRAMKELTMVVTATGRVVAGLALEAGRPDLLEQLNDEVNASRERMNPGITDSGITS